MGDVSGNPPRRRCLAQQCGMRDISLLSLLLGVPLALRVTQRLLKQQGPGEAQWFLFLELAPMPVQG